MGKVALLLIVVLFLLRVLLAVKFKREPSDMQKARNFRLSTLQVLIVVAILAAHALFKALIASIVLLLGLVGIVCLSFLPTRNRPE